MIILRKYSNKTISGRELSNLILFSIGKFVSLFGTFIYAFAIGLYVLNHTGSGLSFATTLISSTLPMVIISPFAGVLADRLNRKILVVLMDIFNGILMIGIYYVSSVYGLSLIMIYISTFIMTSFVTIFNISIEAAKPNIISENGIMKINSISKIIDSMATVLGPMVGGILFAFVDIKLFILFNGISFIFSGISEMFIDFKFNLKETKEEKNGLSFIRDIREGFRYMMRKNDIVSLLVIFVFVNFSIGLSISVPLPFIINNVLNLSAKHFGIIQSAFPLGLITGAIFVKKVDELFSYNKILALMNFILSLCIAMIGLPVLAVNNIINASVLLIYYCTIMFIIGIAISFIDIPLLSILQKSISDEYRGRVLSLVMSVVKIISPIAFVLSGFLINILPQYLLPIVGSLILFIANVAFLKDNDIKDLTFMLKSTTIIRGSIIYFVIELLIFIIFRPKNTEIFLLIWIVIPFLLLLDNMFNLEDVGSWKHVRNIEGIIPSKDLYEVERIGFKTKMRVYGGVLDEINLVYILYFIINVTIYVLVMQK